MKNIAAYLMLITFSLLFLFTASCNEAQQNENIKLGHAGLHGYIAYDSPASAGEFTVGVSFYTAAWKLIDKPIRTFQIGLPGTWIVPDNTDNDSIPLCPVGTLARDNWDERGPTYESVFQTLEGGLGYWARNHYRYGPPKFAMNATSQCYDFEIATPGWSFFYDDTALATDRLGIAQLSNRILIPPDAMTFEGDPQGEFMGYAYMALPFTDAYGDDPPTGDQGWTCFINTDNFKGPIAYYVPETWSKISKDYPIIHGRGLDARPGIIHGGAMEINTVPHFEAIDKDSVVYAKIPQLNFPANDDGVALMVQDLKYYSKDAIFNDFLKWRKGSSVPSGAFNNKGIHNPGMSTQPPRYAQRHKLIKGIDDICTPVITEENVFGLKWLEDTGYETGKFPQYFREEGESMVPVKPEDVPEETGLLDLEFPLVEDRPAYTSPDNDVWNNPGREAGPFTVTINDGSTVTYYWYRFIDQPVFRQFNWTDAKKQKLQQFVEKIHKEWSLDREYIPPPPFGNLVSIDNNLIVTPPEGMEHGYVPVVTRQDRK